MSLHEILGQLRKKIRVDLDVFGVALTGPGLRGRALREGQTFHLRQRHSVAVLGFSYYISDSCVEGSYS